MARPERVADCVEAMMSAVSIPVTIKTRIGIDDEDSYEYLLHFIDTVAAAGCESFIVHARIALLEGLSPKENRSVPPLNYERVYRLKCERPQLHITINGGISTTAQVRAHLRQSDAVMIGRHAYHNPWFLTELEQEFGEAGQTSPTNRVDVVLAMQPYIEDQLASGVPLKHISRHLLGLFAGQPGARAWRRYLSEYAHRPGAGIEVLQSALQRLPQAA
jgi:tRNA-dihydrouridine synthase A